MADPACVFCDIVEGRRLQEIVLSNEIVVSFLCEPPATWGHTLVVPRTHRRDIWDIDSKEAAGVMAAAQLLAAIVRDELGAVGVNLRQNNGSKAGQDVFHFHLHVVPRFQDDLLLPGCVWGSPPWTPPSGGDRERQRVAAAIRRGVSLRTARADTDPAAR